MDIFGAVLHGFQGKTKYLALYIKITKKKPASPESVKKFISDLHAAFNETVNQSLFESNLQILLKKNKSFSNIKDEIHIFFDLSRSIFFENSQSIDYEKTHTWLKLFSLHCRMCERRLIVDIKDIVGENPK